MLISIKFKMLLAVISSAVRKYICTCTCILSRIRYTRSHDSVLNSDNYNDLFWTQHGFDVGVFTASGYQSIDRGQTD